jgi:hypothetical protein
MNLTVNEITKSVTDKFSLYESDLEELQRLIHQYPYFGPAKFLLAKKLKQDNSPLLLEHLQKTSLYFQNPVWLDHLLNDTGSVENSMFVQKEQPVFAPQTETEVPFTHEEVVDQTSTQQPGDTVPEGHLDEKQEENPVLTEEDPSIELPKFKFEPVDISKAELSFEPYHMVDYFASQGIQAKEEEKPKDQLSRQLKSFTEWLKVMKRLPVTEIAAGVSVGDEKKVEKLAETSIHDREVVTEAMAEVWEKQGNVEKAREVYRKLSLLNPSKSSYFAAKIDQLKNL